MSSHELWRAVYAAFPYPINRVGAEVNRIAAKCLKKALGRPYALSIGPPTCYVHEEVIRGSELPNLIRYHDRVKKTSRTTPIVILRIEGKSIVIEGNNRVNRWVANGEPTPRQALIIQPRQSSPTT
jgi:hypothetical protein